MHFKVSGQSRCFDGHFDDAPTLPGVAHLALVLTACAQQAEGSGRGMLVGVRDVRFRRKLGPGDEVEIVLTAGREPFSVRFDIRCGGESATAGQLLFAPPDEVRHE